MSFLKEFIPQAAVAVTVSQCMLENVCVEGCMFSMHAQLYLNACSVVQNKNPTDDGETSEDKKVDSNVDA